MSNANEKKNGKVNTAICVIFTGVLLIMGGLSLLKAAVSKGTDLLISDFDGVYKEGLIFKEELTDIASLCDSLMGRDFADNFNYYNYDGLILNQIWPSDIDNNITREFASFANESESLGYHAKYFFVQQDSRSALLELPSGVCTVDATELEMEQNKEIIDESSAEYIRVPSEYTKFYRTDVHNTKESQIETMQYLVQVMQESGIQFKDREYLDYSDEDLYERKEYDFLGGFGRSCGRFFAGLEKYTQYRPVFDTDITVRYFDRKIGEYMQQSGSAGDVLIRENKERFARYPYYVVDDGYYEKPAYTIINNKCPDGPKVAVIMDSSALSGACYLSLVCSEVTVIDPRFGTGDECAKVLKKIAPDYDAVLMYYLTDSALSYSMFDGPS